jgi:4-hydroxybenzoate polyprenyltransferase
VSWLIIAFVAFLAVVFLVRVVVNNVFDRGADAISKRVGERQRQNYRRQNRG